MFQQIIFEKQIEKEQFWLTKLGLGKFFRKNEVVQFHWDLDTTRANHVLGNIGAKSLNRMIRFHVTENGTRVIGMSLLITHNGVTYPVNLKWIHNMTCKDWTPMLILPINMPHNPKYIDYNKIPEYYIDLDKNDAQSKHGNGWLMEINGKSAFLSYNIHNSDYEYINNILVLQDKLITYLLKNGLITLEKHSNSTSNPKFSNEAFHSISYSKDFDDLDFVAVVCKVAHFLIQQQYNEISFTRQVDAEQLMAQLLTQFPELPNRNDYEQWLKNNVDDEVRITLSSMEKYEKLCSSMAKYEKLGRPIIYQQIYDQILWLKSFYEKGCYVIHYYEVNASHFTMGGMPFVYFYRNNPYAQNDLVLLKNVNEWLNINFPYIYNASYVLTTEDIVLNWERCSTRERVKHHINDIHFYQYDESQNSIFKI